MDPMLFRGTRRSSRGGCGVGLRRAPPFFQSSSSSLLLVLLLVATTIHRPTKESFLWFGRQRSGSGSSSGLVEARGLDEKDRVYAYRTRNHSWPPHDADFVPNTPGWRDIYRRRIDQVERITKRGDMYNAWMSAVHCGLICPNFTEYGWAITRAPQDLLDEMKTSLRTGLASNPPPEPGNSNAAIETENRPIFVNQPRLNARALRELQPILEAWTGIRLVGNNAYGLRVYRNESQLNMHVDKRETHILSAIVHIDHDPDSEPWPIVIEDYAGNLNTVVLESGDVLLYESSKCFHGRPKKFNGSWYSSLFIHYYPVDWNERYDLLETHYRIPPNWDNVKQPMDGLEELVMVDTSAKEPECEDTWCALPNAVKWDVRGEYGKVLSADGVQQDLGLRVQSHDEL